MSSSQVTDNRAWSRSRATARSSPITAPTATMSGAYTAADRLVGSWVVRWLGDVVVLSEPPNYPTTQERATHDVRALFRPSPERCLGGPSAGAADPAGAVSG